MTDWTRDADERRNRMPKQIIEPDDYVRDRSGNVVISPSWRWQCMECGEVRRIASETTSAFKRCDVCFKVTLWEPVGELVYP